MQSFAKKFIIALDPSGNFYEGKGTTGWCIYNSADGAISKAGEISAATYMSQEEYWDAHAWLLHKFCDKYGVDNIMIVIEDYLLYADKAKEQSNSRMETPQLIGVLKYFCWTQHVPYVLQPASEVKKRWSNEILNHKRIILKEGRGYRLAVHGGVISRHTLDAIRHATHYATFKNKRREVPHERQIDDRDI